MSLFYIISTTAKAIFIWGVAQVFLLINIFLERKVSAFIQDRIGPNRSNILGFRLMGLVHNFSDAVKLIFKEDVLPKRADRALFVLAPALVMTVSLMISAVLPFADTVVICGYTIPMQVMDLNVGFLYVLAITSLSVYGIVLGGWASNSKYPMLGALRSSAQMISYEISMGLSLIGLVMIFGTVTLGDLVQRQGELFFGVIPKWGIVVQPLGALLFITAAFAELNRLPFDLAEGESEIVGFHIEYSGVKFALFFMGEYVNIFAASAVITTLFLGGWQVPWLTTGLIKVHADIILKFLLFFIAAGAASGAAAYFRFYRWKPVRWRDLRDKEPLFFVGVLAIAAALALAGLGASFLFTLPEFGRVLLAFIMQVGSFLGKTLFLCFFIIWVRWTLPRFRYDQLMALGWKLMLPVGLINILLTGIIMWIL